MQSIGKIGSERYIDFILWNDGHGHYYRYEGVCNDAGIILAPALIDGEERAANRFYHVKIIFKDNRPVIDRFVKYYFIFKLLLQNHINVSAIEWQRNTVRPANISRPRPKKGPDKATDWFLILFQHDSLFKPVLSRSVERAWHTIYADSPVPLVFVGWQPYSPKQFESFVEWLAPTRHHGDWFTVTDEFQELVSTLNLSKDIA